MFIICSVSWIKKLNFLKKKKESHKKFNESEILQYETKEPTYTYRTYTLQKDNFLL